MEQLQVVNDKEFDARARSSKEPVRPQYVFSFGLRL